MKPILEPHLNARKPTPNNEDAPHSPAHTRPHNPAPNPAHTLGTLTLRPPMRNNLEAQTRPEQTPPALNNQPTQTLPPQITSPAPVTSPVTAPPTSAAPNVAATPPPTAPVTSPPTATAQDAAPDHVSAGITASGLPIPLAKPTRLAHKNAPQPTLLERILATSQTPDSKANNDQTPELAQTDTQNPDFQTALLSPIPPSPPTAKSTEADQSSQSTDTEQTPPPETDLSSIHDDEASDDDFDPIAESDVPPSTPVRLHRFDSEPRMAGGSGYTLGTTERASLPASMRNIRIGRLQESKDVSPIIIPGLQKAAIPRAPDVPRSVDQTRPDEVILFFEENSNRLESGQMAIIHTDVIELLRRRPELKVDIIGYAEELAPEQGETTPEQLSRARALMLRDYLIRNKIDERRIMVTGRANKTRIEPRDRADLFFTR